MEQSSVGNLPVAGGSSENLAKAPAWLYREPSCRSGFGHKVAGLTSEMVMQATELGLALGLSFSNGILAPSAKEHCKLGVYLSAQWKSDLKFKRIWTLTQFHVQPLEEHRCSNMFLSHRAYTNSFAQCCRAGLVLYLIQLLTGENPGHLDTWGKTLLDIFHCLLQEPPATSDVSATHAEVRQDHTKSQQPCLPGFSDQELCSYLHPAASPALSDILATWAHLVLLSKKYVLLTTTQSSFSLSLQEGVKTQTK